MPQQKWCIVQPIDPNGDLTKNNNRKSNINKFIQDNANFNSLNPCKNFPEYKKYKNIYVNNLNNILNKQYKEKNKLTSKITSLPIVPNRQCKKENTLSPISNNKRNSNVSLININRNLDISAVSDTNKNILLPKI